MNTSTREIKNRKVALRLALVVVAMFGFGYALVPLYNVFCEITGLNGKPPSVPVSVAKAGSVVTSRTITVAFVANVNSQLAWAFEPETREIRIHPGEIAKVSFSVSNLTDHAITGRAVPSVSPGQAASHLHKTECFCFTEQVLKAGETKEMPVIFFIDSNLPRDYSEIVLSYTFFNVSDRTSA